jgi:hypothetical protein
MKLKGWESLTELSFFLFHDAATPTDVQGEYAPPGTMKQAQ